MGNLMHIPNAFVNESNDINTTAGPTGDFSAVDSPRLGDEIADSYPPTQSRLRPPNSD